MKTLLLKFDSLATLLPGEVSCQTELPDLQLRPPYDIVIGAVEDLNVIRQFTAYQIAVIVIHLNPTPEQVIEAFHQGAVDYLTTISPERLATAIERAQNYLKEREAMFSLRYRSLFEGTTEAVFLIDVQTESYLDVNQRAADLLGYTVEELLRLPARYVIAPEDSRDATQKKQLLIEGVKLPPYERRFVRKDGSYCTVEVSVTPVLGPGGQTMYMQSIAREITQRKQIETQLRESEARYRLLAENSSDLITLHTPSGACLYVSPSCASILGYGAHEFRALLLYDLLHEADAERIAEVEERADPLDVEIRLRHKNGSYIWLHSYIQLIGEGDNAQIVAFSRDISARKEIEAQQIRLMAEQERTRVLTHFVRAASHEFRTPLSIIMSATYLLQRMPHPERYPDRLNSIQEQVKRLTVLIDGLVLMSKLDTMTSIPCVPMQLNTLLEQLPVSFLKRLADKTLEVELSLTPDLPLIEGNVHDLKTLFFQLIENAIQHSPAGGTITIRSEVAADQVIVAVIDDGRGIAPEIHDRIFERFYRADEAHSTAGFGLGLAIAKRIVELHHGTIRAINLPQAGACFEILFPVSRSPFSEL
ncbi:MAG: PAS domain S-box protein [Anaerolineae bacterium]|jgi:two-component system sporulation sensor kinase A|nr:PAS domain S-box protein [Anaerolineae bacterium]